MAPELFAGNGAGWERGEAGVRVDPEPYASSGEGFRVYRQRGGGVREPSPVMAAMALGQLPTPASPQAHVSLRGVPMDASFPPPSQSLPPLPPPHTPLPPPPPPLRRTRAHVSLRDVPMEALERALDEEMVEVEVEAAEEEGLWQDFFRPTLSSSSQPHTPALSSGCDGRSQPPPPVMTVWFSDDATPDCPSVKLFN